MSSHILLQTGRGSFEEKEEACDHGCGKETGAATEGGRGKEGFYFLGLP